MRRVIWEDERGYLRASLIRDSDPDSIAPQGVPVTIVSELINWDDAKKSLNNLLVERGLFTLEDVLSTRESLASVILAVFRRKLLAFYKELRRQQ